MAGAGRPARGRRRTAFTGRAAISALVVCALMVTLVPFVRDYLELHGTVKALRVQNEQEAARVVALQQQQARWQDPAYVKAQARERLHFVMPGETQYLVVDTPGKAPLPTVLSRQPITAEDHSWFATLWSSVAASDQPAVRRQ